MRARSLGSKQGRGAWSGKSSSPGSPWSAPSRGAARIGPVSGPPEAQVSDLKRLSDSLAVSRIGHGLNQFAAGHSNEAHWLSGSRHS